MCNISHKNFDIGPSGIMLCPFERWVRCGAGGGFGFNRAGNFDWKKGLDVGVRKYVVMVMLMRLRWLVDTADRVTVMKGIGMRVGMAVDSNPRAVVPPRRPIIHILPVINCSMLAARTGADVTAGAGGVCGEGGAGA